MSIKKQMAAFGVAFLTVWMTLGMSSTLSFAKSNSELGLLITGKNVQGEEGFQKNIIYLSREDIEAMKENRNPQAYGLGECWLGPARYSSYDNHGLGNFHYSVAEGLDVPALIDAVTLAGADSFMIYSRDTYSTKMNISDCQSRYYFVPQSEEKTASENPMIAMYMTSTEAGDRESGAEPQEPAGWLAYGSEVFVYGQTEQTESNHCHYIKGANVLVVDEPTTLIKSDTSKFSNLRLHDVIALGVQEKSYTFTDQGAMVTHKVKGAALEKVLEKMDLVRYLPEGADLYLQLESETGDRVVLHRDWIQDSFVVWDYADGMGCPAQQTGELAVYMPGNEKENAVLFNLKKVNVVDSQGTVITSVPAVTVKAPGAPENFQAASAGYDRIRLTWKTSSDADGYYLYRYHTAEKKYKKIKTLPASTVSYIDKNLVTNTTYKYQIRSYKNNGDGVLTGKASAVKSARPVLGKTSVTKLVKYQKTQMRIEWKKVEGASGYQIYRSTEKNGNYRKAGTVKKGSILSFTDRNLQLGKLYYYKIRPYRLVNGSYKYGSFCPVKAVRR